MIEEEISDASKYAKCALDNKSKNLALAETFYKLSNEELGHAMALHTQVVAIIDAYKKEKGPPPELMLKLYDVYHEKYINDFGTVKGMLSLYK